MAIPTIAMADATPTTSSTTAPFSSEKYNSCSNELVVLSGEQHILLHSTIDSSGGLHFTIAMNIDQVRGLGVPSGTSYVGTSASSDTGHNIVGKGPFVGPAEITATSEFNMISQGAEPNFLAHVTSHITVNAQDQVTAVVSDFTIECRG
jgi:hypothetical protein